MDAQTKSQNFPLVVDLDGTLICTDLLWEGLALAIKQNPLVAVLMFYWLAVGGKVRLKREIAARVTPDVAALPYRKDLLLWLRQEKAAGRQLVLATASHRSYAEAIAGHLGFFDAVLATDERNLSGTVKRDALNDIYGDSGYDYVGNSRSDIPLFDSARRAIIAGPDLAADAWHRAHGGLRFDNQRIGIRTLLKLMRVHQWLKNTLVAVPLILSHQIAHPDLVLATVLAFFSFSFAASAIYIVNDTLDIANDRNHPTKHRRPIASGIVPIPRALSVAALSGALSLALCAFLPPLFTLTLVGYLIATTAYSFAIKRMLLIDVLVLATLYIMRLVAGSTAISVPASFWLLAFAGFFFLSLALVKRYVELTAIDVIPGQKLSGRGYRPEDREVIFMAGIGSAFAAVLVMALYVDSTAVRELYSNPWVLWALAPIVLYINLRLWVLANRGEMDADPVVFIIQDWRSQLMAGFGAAILLTAALM